MKVSVQEQTKRAKVSLSPGVRGILQQVVERCKILFAEEGQSDNAKRVALRAQALIILLAPSASEAERPVTLEQALAHSATTLSQTFSAEAPTVHPDIAHLANTLESLWEKAIAAIQNPTQKGAAQNLGAITDGFTTKKRQAPFLEYRVFKTAGGVLGIEEAEVKTLESKAYGEYKKDVKAQAEDAVAEFVDSLADQSVQGQIAALEAAQNGLKADAGDAAPSNSAPQALKRAAAEIANNAGKTAGNAEKMVGSALGLRIRLLQEQQQRAEEVAAARTREQRRDAASLNRYTEFKKPQDRAAKANGSLDTVAESRKQQEQADAEALERQRAEQAQRQAAAAARLEQGLAARSQNARNMRSTARSAVVEQGAGGILSTPISFTGGGFGPDSHAGDPAAQTQQPQATSLVRSDSAEPLPSVRDSVAPAPASPTPTPTLTPTPRDGAADVSTAPASPPDSPVSSPARTPQPSPRVSDPVSPHSNLDSFTAPGGVSLSDTAVPEFNPGEPGGVQGTPPLVHRDSRPDMFGGTAQPPARSFTTPPMSPTRVSPSPASPSADTTPSASPATPGSGAKSPVTPFEVDSSQVHNPPPVRSRLQVPAAGGESQKSGWATVKGALGAVGGWFAGKRDSSVAPSSDASAKQPSPDGSQTVRKTHHGPVPSLPLHQMPGYSQTPEMPTSPVSASFPPEMPPGAAQEVEALSLPPSSPLSVPFETPREGPSIKMRLFVHGGVPSLDLRGVWYGGKAADAENPLDRSNEADTPRDEGVVKPSEVTTSTPELSPFSPLSGVNESPRTVTAPSTQLAPAPAAVPVFTPRTEKPADAPPTPPTPAGRADTPRDSDAPKKQVSFNRLLDTAHENDSKIVFGPPLQQEVVVEKPLERGATPHTNLVPFAPSPAPSENDFGNVLGQLSPRDLDSLSQVQHQKGAGNPTPPFSPRLPNINPSSQLSEKQRQEEVGAMYNAALEAILYPGDEQTHQKGFNDAAERLGLADLDFGAYKGALEAAIVANNANPNIDIDGDSKPYIYSGVGAKVDVTPEGLKITNLFEGSGLEGQVDIGDVITHVTVDDQEIDLTSQKNPKEYLRQLALENPTLTFTVKDADGNVKEVIAETSIFNTQAQARQNFRESDMLEVEGFQDKSLAPEATLKMAEKAQEQAAQQAALPPRSNSFNSPRGM